MKKVVTQKKFHVPGTFESMYAAQSWLRENGYDYGSTSAGNIPTGVMKGDYYDYGLPHKVKNFTKHEKNMLHGEITGDMREGPVFVKIFDNH